MYRSVNHESVVLTVARLRDRIRERFPDSGLGGVADELHDVARASAARALWSARPLFPLRVAMAALVLLIFVGIGTMAVALRGQAEVSKVSLIELVQGLESGINDVIFVGAAIFFLASLESRIKRARVLAAIHELRALAHILDMHQLTKDPERVLREGPDTPSSPERTLSRFELGRYLDYCSELLSLLGKIAALYAQYTNDAVALSAVDQIEDLTSGLSRKIWQKIMVLHEARDEP